MPEKTKIFIEKNLLEEGEIFSKKYYYAMKILSDNKFIVLNTESIIDKSKKITSTENVNAIIQSINIKNNLNKKQEKKDFQKIKIK